MQRKKTSPVAVVIEDTILLMRGQKVMLDSVLADLYQVPTRVLVQAMKRNLSRFPTDFVFQLSKEEREILRSQIVISSGWGGRRYPPYVFTEHGALMLASVLNSDCAIEASVYVVRAFVRMRELTGAHKAITQKLTELERKVVGHDQELQEIFNALRQLMTKPSPPRRQIGFQRRN